MKGRWIMTCRRFLTATGLLVVLVLVDTTTAWAQWNCKEDCVVCGSFTHENEGSSEPNHGPGCVYGLTCSMCLPSVTDNAPGAAELVEQLHGAVAADVPA